MLWNDYLEVVCVIYVSNLYVVGYVLNVLKESIECVVIWDLFYFDNYELLELINFVNKYNIILNI